jgi:hypothetical protein
MVRIVFDPRRRRHYCCFELDLLIRKGDTELELLRFGASLASGGVLPEQLVILEVSGGILVGLCDEFLVLLQQVSLVGLDHLLDEVDPVHDVRVICK